MDDQSHKQQPSVAPDPKLGLVLCETSFLGACASKDFETANILLPQIKKLRKFPSYPPKDAQDISLEEIDRNMELLRAFVQLCAYHKKATKIDKASIILNSWLDLRRDLLSKRQTTLEGSSNGVHKEKARKTLRFKNTNGAVSSAIPPKPAAPSALQLKAKLDACSAKCQEALKRNNWNGVKEVVSHADTVDAFDALRSQKLPGLEDYLDVQAVMFAMALEIASKSLKRSIAVVKKIQEWKGRISSQSNVSKIEEYIKERAEAEKAEEERVLQEERQKILDEQQAKKKVASDKAVEEKAAEDKRRHYDQAKSVCTGLFRKFKKLSQNPNQSNFFTDRRENLLKEIQELEHQVFIQDSQEDKARQAVIHVSREIMSQCDLIDECVMWVLAREETILSSLCHADLVTRNEKFKLAWKFCDSGVRWNESRKSLNILEAAKAWEDLENKLRTSKEALREARPKSKVIVVAALENPVTIAEFTRLTFAARTSYRPKTKKIIPVSEERSCGVATRLTFAARTSYRPKTKKIIPVSEVKSCGVATRLTFAAKTSYRPKTKKIIPVSEVKSCGLATRVTFFSRSVQKPVSLKVAEAICPSLQEAHALANLFSTLIKFSDAGNGSKCRTTRLKLGEMCQRLYDNFPATKTIAANNHHDLFDIMQILEKCRAERYTVSPESSAEREVAQQLKMVLSRRGEDMTQLLSLLFERVRSEFRH